MKIETHENFIWLMLEQTDFRWQDGIQPYKAFLGDMQSAIPDDERLYVDEDKCWLIENTEKNRAIISTLRGHHFA